MTHTYDNIPELLLEQKQYAQAGHCRSIASRLSALQKLRQAIIDYEPQILEALRIDLNKSELEAYSTEIGIVYEELKNTLKQLRAWMKPKKVKTALTHIGSRGFVVPEPYGTALIIAPWNYPFQLAISPLIGAIAAGNTAIVKPSELTPSTSQLLAQIIGSTFAPDRIAVVEGGPECSQQLLEQSFDYIFFTGSVAVGRIVMQAAAKQLIPVTLELGGKSPCIVHKDADLKLAARRIAFGKFTNAGQTCVAPDYLLVHRSCKAELLAHFQSAISEFYGEAPLENPQYGRIVSQRHYERLEAFLSEGTVLHGGRASSEQLRIEPTLLAPASLEAPVMQEEIFGPIFPVLEYDDLEEAIQLITSRPKPLALYLFTSSKSVEQHVLQNTSSGGVCVNDTLMHIATPYLPFGGVGESGMGAYHGYSSFATFSHFKSVLKQPTWFDVHFRYPSSKRGVGLLRRLMKP